LDLADGSRDRRVQLEAHRRRSPLLDWCIAPHLGAILLQRLTTLDLERWHVTLHQRIGGQTIKGAHRLLKQALAKGARPEGQTDQEAGGTPRHSSS
jgi:hypothetical protein